LIKEVEKLGRKVEILYKRNTGVWN
jgi:hypothetical protein